MSQRRIHKGFIVLIFLTLLASGCAATRMAKEAQEFASLGVWDEAVLKYREALSKDPDNIQYMIKYRQARGEAANVHYDRGEKYLTEGNHEAALLEFQAAVMLDPSLKKSESAAKKTKKLMDSIYHYGKGVEFLKAGKQKDAMRSFKKAISLNPENESAKGELEKLKKASVLIMDGYELDIKSAKPITLEFKDANIKRVFEVVSKLSGMNFIFDSDVRDTKTSIFLKDAEFKQVLELLLMSNNLAKKAVSENTIIIYPSTPAKDRQYQEMLVKVFYLTNIDAKKAVNLLRTMIKAPDIYVHDELNAIVIRAKSEAIELARKILDATDLADAEVVLVVDILEVSRNKAMNLGVKLPNAITATIPYPAVPGGGILLKDLDAFSSEDLLITIPSGILNLKLEDLDAELLANPRIRVKNNEKAKIHIGDRVPIITATVVAGAGTTTESVQYQDVGLKLNVEPKIRPNDEIDLKVNLEVSSLGAKTTTEAGSVVYQIGTRNAETTLRLSDGETQVIGGLITDEERTTTVKVPGLGNIPILGKLFSNTDKSKVKTDILLSITPHIVRKVEIPDEDVTSIPSGRIDAPSASFLMEEFVPEEFMPEEEFIPPPPPPPGFFPEPPDDFEDIPPS